MVYCCGGNVSWQLRCLVSRAWIGTSTQEGVKMLLVQFLIIGLHVSIQPPDAPPIPQIRPTPNSQQGEAKPTELYTIARKWEDVWQLQL